MNHGVVTEAAALNASFVLKFLLLGLFTMLVCCYSEKCGITGKDNRMVGFKLLQKGV